MLPPIFSLPGHAGSNSPDVSFARMAHVAFGRPISDAPAFVILDHANLSSAHEVARGPRRKPDLDFSRRPERCLQLFNGGGRVGLKADAASRNLVAAIVLRSRSKKDTIT
jgi:hypothetical protein